MKVRLEIAIGGETIYTVRGAGSRLALVRRLSEYIAMLALCKEVPAIPVVCNGALKKCVYWGGWEACPPGKFRFLGFLRWQFWGKMTY